MVNKSKIHIKLEKKTTIFSLSISSNGSSIYSKNSFQVFSLNS